MEKNELTYEQISDAVKGKQAALDQVLMHYDDYIKALATVWCRDESGKEYAYVDEDIKIRIQMKLVKSIPKWRGLKK